MENISLEGLMRQYVGNSTKQMFTAMPARVERISSQAEQRVDVQLLIDRITPDENTLSHPVILNVPLIFPGSSTSQFSFPVNVGDTVLCIFSQRSISQFKLGVKQPHRPTDFAKFSRKDAMAIPGLFGFPDAVNNPTKRSLAHNTDDTVMTHNIGSSAECEVRLTKAGDVIINAPGNKVEVNCQESVVNTNTAAINASTSTTIDSPNTTVTGDMLVQGTFTYTSGMVGSGTAGGSTASITGSISVTGDVTASGVSLVNHTHTGDSGGTTSPPN